MLLPPHSPPEPQALALAFILALGAGGRGGVIDGDLWWASTNITTEEGSDVIGKYFTANHYDYTLCYTWNYITQNGTNRIGIICPEGWRLPTTNEQVALVKASGFTGVNQDGTSAGLVNNYNGTGNNGRWLGPGVATGGSDASKYTYTTYTHLFFPFSGYRYDGSNNVPANIGVGTRTDTWSSTPSSSSYAYRLEFQSSFIRPQMSDYRTSGVSIRCVADPL